MNQEIKNIDEQGEELYEHYKFIADNGQEKLRIDKFLMDRVGNTSRNKIQIAAHNGNKNGKLLRDYISKRMPREESQKLKSIAISCINKNYNKC